MCLGRLVDARKSESHKEIPCPCQSSDPPFRPSLLGRICAAPNFKTGSIFSVEGGDAYIVGLLEEEIGEGDNNSCGFSVPGQATFGAT
jgi:hypothetical protein